jgi:hypothetical protein
VRRVLLGPSNLAYALPAEVSGAVERVQGAVVAYLEARELEVERLDLAEGRKRWREAAAQAKGQGSEGAVAIFARQLAAERDFQVLILPSLLMFSVRVVDSSGTWDGVRRSLSMVNRPSLGPPGSADTLSKGMVYGGVTGDALATSLHVLVYSPDGERIFEGRGGFDFIQEIDLAHAPDWRWEFHPTLARLRDPEVLNGGVEIALSPYLRPR